MQKQVKNNISEEKALQLIKSLQFILVCSQLVLTEFDMDLVDTRFKNPNLNNFAKKIKDNAEFIQLHLRSIIKPKSGNDREYTIQYINELWRILHHFIGMDIAQLEEYADGLDQMFKEQEV